MKKVFVAALVLGIALPTTSVAATSKPSIKNVAGAEGTSAHEAGEAATGTKEKVAKKNVIKKSATPKKAAKKTK